MDNDRIRTLISNSLNSSKSDISLLLAASDEILRSADLGEMNRSARTRMFSEANAISEQLTLGTISFEEALRAMVRSSLAEVRLCQEQIRGA